MEVTVLTPPPPTKLDSKYVVLKQSQVDEMMTALFGGDEPPTWAYDELDGYTVEDAVVIRTCDEFAGPALHSYAYVISAVANYIEKDEVRQTLRDVADYFTRRAFEADQIAHSGDAKLPGVSQ